VCHVTRRCWATCQRYVCGAHAEPGTKTVPLGMPGTRTVAGTDNRSGGKSRSPINSSTAYYSAIKHMVFVYPKPSSAIAKLFLNRFERGLGYTYLLSKLYKVICKKRSFLANVNSCSRSLYAIARPFVCHLAVCNACAPYSGG